MVINNEKWCPDCKKYLEIENFNKNRYKKDGYSSYCKRHSYLRNKKSIFNKILRGTNNGILIK